MNTKLNIEIALRIIELNGGLINASNGYVIAKFNDADDYSRCYHAFVKSPLTVTPDSLNNQLFVAV
jgi:hypothetical protein